MKGKKEILTAILAEKLVSIIRLNNQDAVQAVIDSLVEGGIKILEITTNTPGFHIELENARKRHPDVLIGAGTVINASLAEKAIGSGAQFLVTPNTNKKVIDVALKPDIPVLMGALTPTEVSNAIDYGADIIKLFPAGSLGMSYFTALKGPFKETAFFAVGGIDIENMNAWFKAGISGVGIGGSLVKGSARTLEDMNEIKSLAQQFTKQMKN